MDRVYLFVAMSVFVFFGCAGELQNMSSGQVGCDPKEIEIVGEKTHYGSRTWTAECAGKTFYCESRAGSDLAPAEVSCTESASETTSGS